MPFSWIAGSILALLWVSRLIETAWGLPRLADVSVPDTTAPPAYPRLTVIVPARNEERDVEACLASLLALDYPDAEVIAIDDRSTDATGEIMDRLAAAHPGNLHVIHVAELPPGWMGKTHAMWSASERATGDLLLFTDGDVVFHPASVRAAVNYLLRTATDHLVLFPTMLFKHAGEKVILSFFQAALSFAHRPWRVRDPKAYDHIGVGAFNLIRRSAYNAVGTYAAMRMEVVDDLRLGKLVKDHGFRQDVVLGRGLVKIHWATGAIGVAHALSKNGFAVMRFSWTLVIAGCIGLAFVSLGPLVGLFLAPGWAKVPYVAALAAIAGLYALTKRVNGISPLYFVFHPVAAALTIYAMLRSAWLTSTRGVTWRGTIYPLQQFKKRRED